MFGCVVINVIVSTIGIVSGLPLGFRWSVEISWRMGLFEEQDGAFVGVFLPLPSGSAYGPLSMLLLALIE